MDKQIKDAICFNTNGTINYAESYRKLDNIVNEIAQRHDFMLDFITLQAKLAINNLQDKSPTLEFLNLSEVISEIKIYAISKGLEIYDSEIRDILLELVEKKVFVTKRGTFGGIKVNKNEYQT